jgi:hypothetical protein
LVPCGKNDLDHETDALSGGILFEDNG